LVNDIKPQDILTHEAFGNAIPSDHPLFMSMLGMHGNYAPNINTNKCDVLIDIGMRFDDRVTRNLSCYAEQAKIIHI